MLTGRQEKIMAILKGNKLSPEFNNTISRKYFQLKKEQSDGASMGADLAAVNSTRFKPANAFITTIDSPNTKSNLINKS
jgi:hypothetical protein